MNGREFLEILHVAERLKDTLRHSTTTNGRPESVAEHSWRTALMALLLSGEFPELDIHKVVAMCLIHDLGECFTGDIPSFRKTDADRQTEDDLLERWVASLPEELSKDLSALFREMDAQKTGEAKLYKALDKLEALIAHNESDLDTWLPLEYDLQFTYGRENTDASPTLRALREAVDAWSRRKIDGGAADREAGMHPVAGPR